MFRHHQYSTNTGHPIRTIQRWWQNLPRRRRWLMGLLPGLLIAGALVWYWSHDESLLLLPAPACAAAAVSGLIDTGAGDTGTNVSGGNAATNASGGTVANPPAGNVATPLAGGVGGSTTAAEASSAVCVYLSGAVITPGVVHLPPGSRLIDAVTSCGGLSSQAAAEYINLAALLVDGTHVHIPDQAEIEAYRQQGNDPTAELLSNLEDLSPGGALAGNGASGSGSVTTSSGFPINVNSADLAALQTVPGIGPVTAQRIVDYRLAHGPYQQLSDLLAVSGIGEKRLADFANYLTCQ